MAISKRKKAAVKHPAIQAPEDARKSSWRDIPVVKLGICAVVILCLALCVLALITQEQRENSRREQTQVQQFLADKNNRMEMRNEWFRAGDLIVKMTEDEQAREVMHFLKKNSCLVKARDNNRVWTVEKPPTVEHPIGLFFFTPEDIKMNPAYYKRFIDANAFAQFWPGTKGWTIALLTEPLSVIARGVLLLHEAKHAKNEVDRHVAPANSSNVESDVDEVDVCEFTQSLMLKIGGQDYSNLLDAEVTKLMQMMDNVDKYGAEPDFKISEVGRSKILNKVYQSEPTSDMEAELRQSDFRKHVLYRLTEVRFPHLNRHDLIDAKWDAMHLR